MNTIIVNTGLNYVVNILNDDIMSTRANIQIISKQGTIYLYRHCDGRPKDLGESIRRYLHRLKHWDAEKIAHKLQNGLKYWDIDLIHRIEETSCVHGDEDYIYLINIAEKTLKCYQHFWDEPVSKWFVPEREVEIHK